MDDIDLLVRSEDIALAHAVGEEIGLGFGSSQLPAFFYRLTNFATPLQPDLETLATLDLHWQLHSPTLLLTDRIEQVWARRRTISVYGFPTSVLDPADQWLHLATHLWSHWGRTPTPAEVPEVKAIVEAPDITVALKWVADLVCTTSSLPQELTSKGLAERAAEWSAEAEAAATLTLLRPLLARAGLAFAWEVLAAVGGSLPARRRRGSEASPQVGERCDPTLGFRLGTFRRLPAWIFPPERYLRALSGAGRGPAGTLTLLGIRVVHAARVVARSALAAAVLPVAVLGRRLAKRSRENRIRAAKSPARVVELLRKFREFEIAYTDRFAPDRSASERV